MSTMQFKRNWLDEYHGNIDYFEGSIDPFENWDSRRCYSSWASWFLKNALVAAYADASALIIEKFAQAAISIVDRAFNENRIGTDPDALRSHGDALATRAYSKALLGYPLNLSDLSIAANDYYLYVKTGPWSSLYEGHYLSAMRMACIAQDKKLLGMLVKTKKQFRFNADEFDVFRRITNVILLDQELSDPHLLQDMNRIFNLYLDPSHVAKEYFEADIGRFEYGIIYFKYIYNNKYGILDILGFISR